MRNPLFPLLSALLLSPLALAVPSVLVYTYAAGHAHDSIPTAIDVLNHTEIEAQYGVNFTFIQDQLGFNQADLSTFDGVFFISTTGEALDQAGQAAVKTFFQSGGVYTGVHAAADCLYNDTTYGQAVGAWFDYRDSLQNATFTRLNNTHPATQHLPDRWTFMEEVYHLRNDPRDNGATILLSVDQTSFINDGNTTGDYPAIPAPQPIAWYIDSPLPAQPLLEGAPKAGRSFYTSLGHSNETWHDELFIRHVMSGLKWALDGASTRAYGVGIVGNGNGDASTTVGVTSSPPNHQPGVTSYTITSSASAATSTSNTNTIQIAAAASAQSTSMGNAVIMSKCKVQLTGVAVDRVDHDVDGRIRVQI
ncbi:uncharacterized protein I303_107198 [Kwoniella dejecticola CBS 10117]|uniref:ThuA-like domain-containing protein n=1 Tax=Kwoniella dejecticola CBS 10117 TaxID=1296121 RepID=A0A1A5ZZ25_9TREE|nr:uncharacterized protein I303_06599 [Kwoniella dejecticola CBS 10117]OBR83040.1 hypothetical protein I303_06599 [Kwoniella dejecticola CBS 10117]